MHQHQQQNDNFNPEGQRRMAPLPVDEYEPQQQHPQDIRQRAPAGGHQEVWRNYNVS